MNNRKVSLAVVHAHQLTVIGGGRKHIDRAAQIVGLQVGIKLGRLLHRVAKEPRNEEKVNTCQSHERPRRVPQRVRRDVLYSGALA